MKKIKKSTIIWKLRRAYSKGREHQTFHFSHTFSIMINTEDAKIWCDCFISFGDYIDYQRTTIHKLSIYSECTVNENIKYLLEEAIDLLIKDGWEIEG